MGWGVSKSSKEGIKLHPDAWARFECTAGLVAKSPPRHELGKKMTATMKRRALKPKKKPGK
jgi:hypothetical protein